MQNQPKRNVGLREIPPGEKLYESTVKPHCVEKRLTTLEAIVAETLGKDVQELSQRLQIVEDSLREVNAELQVFKEKLFNTDDAWELQFKEGNILNG